MKTLIIVALCATACCLSASVSAQQPSYNERVERATVRNLVLNKVCGITATDDQMSFLRMISEHPAVEQQAERLTRQLALDCKSATNYVKMSPTLMFAGSIGALLNSPEAQKEAERMSKLGEQVTKEAQAYFQQGLSRNNKAPSASAGSTPGQDFLDYLEGWWGLSADGCFDEDNQYRVAVGRWQRTDAGVSFGKGDFRIGFYDGGCQISDMKQQSTTLTGKGSCNFEGEEETGPVRLQLENQFTLRATYPKSPGEGLLLVQCGKLTRNDLQK